MRARNAGGGAAAGGLARRCGRVTRTAADWRRFPRPTRHGSGRLHEPRAVPPAFRAELHAVRSSRERRARPPAAAPPPAFVALIAWLRIAASDTRTTHVNPHPVRTAAP